jgi:hypothetical protein
MGNYQNKKMRNYFRIFEQLYENPGTITYKLSENIAQNYREYVYLMQFEDPMRAFYDLKRCSTAPAIANNPKIIPKRIKSLKMEK